jgi:hypothetical protein
MLFGDRACFRFDRIPVRPKHWLWRPYLACGNPALRSSRPACAEGRLSFVAVVEFGLAARRQLTPMRVRPTDPRRAHCRPYGLGRRRIRCTPAVCVFGTGSLQPFVRGDNIVPALINALKDEDVRDDGVDRTDTSEQY